MAEPGSSTAASSSSSSSDAAPPSPPAPPPPPQNEWEVLTMSMSSSAFAGSNAANTSPSVSPTLPDTDPVDDKQAEPFTEGWKPNIRIPSLMVASHENIHELDPFSVNYQVESHYATQDMPSHNDDASAAEKQFTSCEEKIGEQLLPMADVGDADPADLVKKVKKRQIDKARTKQGISRKSKAVWSITVAATVVGIAVLLRQLHHERQQNVQLRLELSSKQEELNKLMSGMGRVQKVLFGSA